MIECVSETADGATASEVVEGGAVPNVEQYDAATEDHFVCDDTDSEFETLE